LSQSHGHRGTASTHQRSQLEATTAHCKRWIDERLQLGDKWLFRIADPTCWLYLGYTLGSTSVLSTDPSRPKLGDSEYK
jgi:hypothetical protein